VVGEKEGVCVNACVTCLYFMDTVQQRRIDETTIAAKLNKKKGKLTVTAKIA
jgi:hypothetical protein